MNVGAEFVVVRDWKVIGNHSFRHEIFVVRNNFLWKSKISTEQAVADSARHVVADSIWCFFLVLSAVFGFLFSFLQFLFGDFQRFCWFGTCYHLVKISRKRANKTKNNTKFSNYLIGTFQGLNLFPESQGLFWWGPDTQETWQSSIAIIFYVEPLTTL